jgi:lysophospholipase L1-like esterase
MPTRNHRTAFGISAAALGCLSFVLAGVNPACPAADKAGPERWAPQIAAFEAEDAKSPPAPGGVLFVGSSSIRLWDLKQSFPDAAAINRGFGGSQVADVLYYVDRIVLKYKPRLVVLYAGDNDIAGGKSAEQVVADYRQLVAAIHAKLPRTRILFLAIKPSLRRWALVSEMRKANRQIRRIASDEELLGFVDIDAPMLGDDGRPRPELFRDDGLHLNERGYQVWARVLRPLLEPQ